MGSNGRRARRREAGDARGPGITACHVRPSLRPEISRQRSLGGMASTCLHACVVSVRLPVEDSPFAICHCAGRPGVMFPIPRPTSSQHGAPPP
jgi:hypothetical protein